jgi:hypothetical protein
MGYAQVVHEGSGRPRSRLWALRQALEVGKPRNYAAFTLRSLPGAFVVLACGGPLLTADTARRSQPVRTT